MKKAFVLFAFAAAAMTFTACGGGEPDLNNPEAVATYMCDKTKDMMEFAKDLEGNKDKIEALDKEMQAFEEKIEAAHKDDEQEFQEKVQEAFKKVCDINLGL
ncbi:MAG: hypothetical protein AAGN35_09600 [Bacteroidota bacterium]